MCLAVPGKIDQIGENRRATVDMLGVKRQASLRLVPDAKVGDYVLVHAGFGIQVIDPEEARETIEIIKQMPGIMDEDVPAGGFGSAADPATPVSPMEALAGALA